ncbi:MAG: DegT/DnrJ/EryC1/StrS family aminotransferase [Clostridia bacterium]|nr:DegT/DnrJ/EryC1/StrS family aminotransferase [Clostridia bacterium]
MEIKFSPPDITEAEIAEVVDALRSGWITTGPKTKKFEKEIASYCGTTKAVCLNSATAGLELILRVLGVGPGDEVITSAYTYTASASVIAHVGAKMVLCDVQKHGVEMDYDRLENLVTERTKAIIPVDIAGIMCDYDRIFAIVERKKSLFRPAGDMQQTLGRIAVVADAAHSFGAVRKGKKSGNIADFSSFSFHAVKNLTTAEGGAVTWRPREDFDDEDLYRRFMLLSLHGQSKDALAKTKLGAWEYDIVTLGYKCNMTDVVAGIGLAQLARYDGLLARRKAIMRRYREALEPIGVRFLSHEGTDFCGSHHLCIVRLPGYDEQKRNAFIENMAKRGVATNVHYKPLPMHTAYKAIGFSIEDYPNAYDFYKNEVTLPLHTLLSDEEAEYVVACVKECYVE